MAVAFDTAFEDGGSGASFSFTSNAPASGVSGSIGANSNRVLIAAIAFRGVSATGIALTWDGASMTAIGSLLAIGNYHVQLFGLVGPATGAKVLAATWTGGAATVVLGAVSLYNASGWQNATSNTGSGAGSATITVTSANGNAIVAARVDDNYASASISSGTQDWDERDLTGNYGGGHKLSTGTSETITWGLGGAGSADGWGMVGVDVIAASSNVTATPAQAGLTLSGTTLAPGFTINMPDEP